MVITYKESDKKKFFGRWCLVQTCDFGSENGKLEGGGDSECALIFSERDRENIERLEITGVGDPTGRGLGFSYVRVTPKAPISNSTAKKKSAAARGGSTVTGTDADLRRLSMDAAREISRSDDNTTSPNVHTPPLVIVRQFFVGMFVIDTWQYFWHRYMHVNKFLYRHIHSWHHRLIVPYAFGSQYNHPLEGLILDTLGGALAYLLSGMSARTSIFFFSFSTIKGIDDHCGLWLPGNIFHMFFWNNTAYHDIHHQLFGTKYNFSQPFFITWDKIFRTHMPYTLEKRPDGGLEARPISKR
ncbi:sphinganine C4-monooxygenase 1-like [Ananas comosus]|uniref:aldehyde oxygenase (deformylating) n=1 Tax=Ananas comosus TaxID=4615 RepID=A0A6P5F4R4_ANACO|nr:sphinganine C4-monooxygenase 1-like [Ananas comosus]